MFPPKDVGTGAEHRLGRVGLALRGGAVSNPASIETNVAAALADAGISVAIVRQGQWNTSQDRLQRRCRAGILVAFRRAFRVRLLNLRCEVRTVQRYLITVANVLARCRDTRDRVIDGDRRAGDVIGGKRLRYALRFPAGRLARGAGKLICDLGLTKRGRNRFFVALSCDFLPAGWLTGPVN